MQKKDEAKMSQKLIDQQKAIHEELARTQVHETSG
jgi:hypothetical protein